jgi:hypothetical protein
MRGLHFFCTNLVTVLGILGFCLGFAPYAKLSLTGEPSLKTSVNFFDNDGGSGVGVVGLSLMLVAGFVAAFGLLPRQAANEPVVVGLSLAGFLTLLFLMIGIRDGLDVGVGLILVLVSSFLQTALAIVNLLISAGVAALGMSTPRARYPQQSACADYNRAPGVERPDPRTRVTPWPNRNAQR